MDSKAEMFFQSKYFAVVGASSNQSKFGYKVFAWYCQQGLPVTPINPSSPDIQVGNHVYRAKPSIETLPHLPQTSMSIITPPATTAKILEQARTLGVRSVWLQPGSFDSAVLNFAREAFEIAVGSHEGRTTEGNGWCILVDGKNALDKALKGSQGQTSSSDTHL